MKSKLLLGGCVILTILDVVLAISVIKLNNKSKDYLRDKLYVCVKNETIDDLVYNLRDEILDLSSDESGYDFEPWVLDIVKSRTDNGYSCSVE